ncbi:MAG: hypothetical protein J6B53_00135 [Clostridia bacterium]|nr:hypothetical protein [Clostridia bacterium]
MTDQNMNELNMNDLEQVTGGVIVDNGGEQLFLVRQDGTIIGPAPRNKAKTFANSFSTSTEVISKEDYEKRFGRPFVW